MYVPIYIRRGKPVQKSYSVLTPGACSYHHCEVKPLESSLRGKQSKMVQTLSSLGKKKSGKHHLEIICIWKYFKNHSVLSRSTRRVKMGICFIL